MRRTEMVTKIINLTYDATDGSVLLNQDNADTLLGFIEKAGMKPPTLDPDKCKRLFNIYIEPDYNVWDEDFEKDMKERLK